jgi:tetratricopeptide (TPR) repeat protein
MKTFALYVAFLQFCCTSWFDLGLEYQWSGKHEKAVACFNQIKSTSKNYYAANLLKSVIMWGDLRKREDAIKNLDEGIKINPHNIKAWLNKAQVLKDFDEYEGSNACYDKASEIDPNNDSVWYGKASLLYKWGKYSESIKWCNKVINKDPTSWAALKIKGDSYYKQGKYKRAYKAFNMASQYNKKDIELKLSMANALYMRGKFDEAKEQYEYIEKFDPKDISILYGKAMCLKALGKDIETKQTLEKALLYAENYDHSNEFYGLHNFEIQNIKASIEGKIESDAEFYNLAGTFSTLDV